MYKLIAVWSAPKPEDEAAFEDHYLNIHAPLAAKVPGLQEICITRTSDGLEGGAPSFYRIAEMGFANAAALEQSSHSTEWTTLRADAGVMIEKFGVSLTVGIGTEVVMSLGS
jgi:uncharacterized protein (TIGR02118 family)